MSTIANWFRSASAQPEARELHLLGATGTCRREMYDGKEHLVVPVIALMEGVIHAVNSPEKEFVPLHVLQASPNMWNGRPVVLGHPAEQGIQISANSPKVLERHRIGTIFNASASGSRLCMEAWIDPDRLRALGEEDLLKRCEAGEMIEVSVGAYVQTEKRASEYQGKPYKAVWRSMASDHLAFLPRTRGACSIEMGCGAHRAAEAEPADIHLITAEGLVEVGTMEEIRAAGGPGSGWHAEAGHVPGSQGGDKGKQSGGARKIGGAVYGDESKFGKTSIQEKHSYAHDAHSDAAALLEKAIDTESSKDIEAAIKASNTAAKLTKATGAKPYGSEAATHYIKKAQESDRLASKTMKSKHIEDKIQNLREALKMHKAAAVSHGAAEKMGVKRNLEETLEALAEYDGEGCPHLHTMETLFEQCSDLYDAAKEQLDSMLEADAEGESPDEASLEALITLCNSMSSMYSQITNLAYMKLRPKKDGVSAPRYMEELRAAIGKRNNASDLAMIQTMHDNAVALGATCAELENLEEGAEEDESGWFRSAGGPGSGWHAEGGHVPGSQGGKGGKEPGGGLRGKTDNLRSWQFGRSKVQGDVPALKQALKEAEMVREATMKSGRGGIDSTIKAIKDDLAKAGGSSGGGSGQGAKLADKAQDREYVTSKYGSKAEIDEVGTQAVQQMEQHGYSAKSTKTETIKSESDNRYGYDKGTVIVSTRMSHPSKGAVVVERVYSPKGKYSSEQNWVQISPAKMRSAEEGDEMEWFRTAGPMGDKGNVEAEGKTSSDCTHCKGTGKMPSGAECDYCDGSGRMRAAATQKDCEECDGTGKIDGKDCKYCEGNGQVSVKGYEGKWFNPSDENTEGLSFGTPGHPVEWLNTKDPLQWEGTTAPKEAQNG